MGTRRGGTVKDFIVPRKEFERLVGWFQFFPVVQATERDMGLIDRMTATEAIPQRMLLSKYDCIRLRVWFEHVPKVVRDRADFTFLDQINFFLRTERKGEE